MHRRGTDHNGGAEEQTRHEIDAMIARQTVATLRARGVEDTGETGVLACAWLLTVRRTVGALNEGFLSVEESNVIHRVEGRMPASLQEDGFGKRR